MQNEQMKLIAEWLSQYVIPKDGGLALPEDPLFLKDGIRLLMEHGIMNEEEIRREALNDYGVIIPWELIN